MKSDITKMHCAKCVALYVMLQYFLQNLKKQVYLRIHAFSKPNN